MRTMARLLSLAAATGLLALPPAALHAETVVVDDQVLLRPSDLPRPARGITMHEVEAKFGAPVSRHDAVGAPPITRWDYAGFSVFFEGERVIHSVVIGA